MTNKEAISVIKSECYIFNPLDFDRTTRINTALDMAVEALEKQDRFLMIMTYQSHGKFLMFMT